MLNRCLSCVAWSVVLAGILCATGCQKPQPPSSESDAKALAEAKALLASSGDINAKDKDGWTKMRHAVWNDHLATMRFLISKGTNLSERDCFGYSLLHAAALQGHLEAMRLLIEHGADIKARSIIGRYTPLHLAAWEGSVDTVKLLVLHNAHVDTKGNANLTPLFFAAASGSYEAAEFLISHGTSVTASTTNGVKPLHLAAGGYELMLSARFQIGFAATPPDESPFIERSRGWYKADHDKVVRLLVKNGADVNRICDGGTPLYLASLAGNLRAVKALLELGADPSWRTETACWELSGKEGYNALDCAVDGGIRRNREQGGELVEALIRAGAKVNQYDGTGKTPLHHAVENIHLDATSVLIKAGADVNAVDKKFVPKTSLGRALTVPSTSYRHPIGKSRFGRTPLFTALRADFPDFFPETVRPQLLSQRLEVVKLLLDKGADISAKLPDGATPLHIAMLVDKPEEVAEFLLARGADVGAKDNELATPLHYAVAGEWNVEVSRDIVRIGLVRMLVKNGARLNVCTKAGKTPLDWAVEFRDEQEIEENEPRTSIAREIIKILKDAAAAEKRGE